jgi:hypothetical protein
LLDHRDSRLGGSGGKEESMSAAFNRFDEKEFPQALMRLRNQAAVVRALVDDLDRVAPVVRGDPRDPELTVLGARVVEEFAHLACRLLECATVAAPPRGSRTAIP